MQEFLHFDLVNLVGMVVIAIAAWVSMKNTLSWHTTWIKKHDQECDEQRKINNKILTALQTTSAHLATLTEGHEKRIDRLERTEDRARV